MISVVVRPTRDVARRELTDRRRANREAAYERVRWMLARRWTPRAMASALPGLTEGAYAHLARRIAAGASPRLTDQATAAILGPLGAPTEGRVGAIGSRRRVRALVRSGRTLIEIERVTGLDDATLSLIARGTTDTLAVVAVDIETAYERLSVRPGRDVAAAERGLAAGWAPVSAWYGIDMDDPDAAPAGNYPACDRPLPTAEEARRAAEKRARDAAAEARRRARRRARRDAARAASVESDAETAAVPA